MTHRPFTHPVTILLRNGDGNYSVVLSKNRTSLGDKRISQNLRVAESVADLPSKINIS